MQMNKIEKITIIKDIIREKFKLNEAKAYFVATLKNMQANDLTKDTIENFIDTLDESKVDLLFDKITTKFPIVKQDDIPFGEQNPVTPQEPTNTTEAPTTPESQELVTTQEQELVPTEHPQGVLAKDTRDRSLTTIEDIERYIKVMEMVQERAVSIIKKMHAPSSFVIFGESVCFNAKAVYKVFSQIPMPIDVRNVKGPITTYDKEGYPSYQYTCKARNNVTGMELPISYIESSKKGFWADDKKWNDNTKKYDKFVKPADQVNLRDVQTAAYHGLYKEIFLLFFGMKNLTRQEAREMGIDLSKVTIAIKGKEDR